ncbi:putative sporulation protein YtxC [Siminovitchia sp. 179-K 8D1 HS]|uniref:putative sporulation protein YtxC n=1 Tax=Siminovitchia sp. 179-K 8D1 HS TaxID=3142385 RepID=UPI0039A343CD
MELAFLSADDASRLQSFFLKTGISLFCEKQSGRYVFSFPKGEDQDRFVEALTEFIIHVKRAEFLDQILVNRFYYENEEERLQIIEIVNAMCLGKREELTALTAKMNEHSIVKQAVASVFETDDAVLLESLLTFRLKDYYEALTQYLHVAIDEYKMEQDYQMFVNMLRDYLNKQKPKKKLVHLSLTDPVCFYDEDSKEMTRDEVMELVDRRLLFNHPVYIDSAVIAPLLSIAPKKIFLYTDSEEKAIIRTLLNIFEERLKILPLADLP